MGRGSHLCWIIALMTTVVALYDDGHHGVAMQCTIQGVELFARSGANGKRKAEIVAAFAGPHLDRGRIEVRVELLYECGERLGEIRMRLSHHLDGKVAGILD